MIAEIKVIPAGLEVNTGWAGLDADPIGQH